MQVSGDFTVGMMALTNGKGETKRYVKRHKLTRTLEPHLALVSRMQAALLSGKDGEPLLKGNRFPLTVVIEQSAQAAAGVGMPLYCVGAWAYAPDEKGYRIREEISAFESDGRVLTPAALTKTLRSSRPEFTWSLTEVGAEVDRYARERGYGS